MKVSLRPFWPLILALASCPLLSGAFFAPSQIMQNQSTPPSAPVLPSGETANSATGILLMAHGGKVSWNQTVLAVAAETNKTMPTEVAFGMADHATLQQAIDKLNARGVKQIVAVPLFVSSHSVVVIESTKYLLGLRPGAPGGFADLVGGMFEMAGQHDKSNAESISPQDTNDGPRRAAPTPAPNSPANQNSTAPPAVGDASQDAANSSASLAPTVQPADPKNPPPDPPEADARARARAHATMDYSSVSADDVPTLNQDTSEPPSSTPGSRSPSNVSNSHPHSAGGNAAPANHTTSSKIHPAPVPAPVQSSVPIHMASALDHHAVVAEILADRAAAMSQNPRQEVLILVAHGPNEDAENAQWLSDMRLLATQIAAHHRYARIDCVTLRDDADPPVRNAATAELRKKVQDADGAGYHVLVVPLLLSYGGIENDLRQRLDGLEHSLSSQPLLPDPRIAKWILASAAASESNLGFAR